MRTDSAFDVGRIVALSDEELSNLRGPFCKDCGSRDCELPACDRCAKRHVHDVIELDGKIVILCKRCLAPAECASCRLVQPRYLMGSAEGETFCKTCYGQDPVEAWT